MSGEFTEVIALVKPGGNPTAEVKMLSPTFSNIYIVKLSTIRWEKNCIDSVVCQKAFEQMCCSYICAEGIFKFLKIIFDRT